VWCVWMMVVINKSSDNLWSEIDQTYREKNLHLSNSAMEQTAEMERF